MNWMLAGIEHWNQVCVSSGRLWPFHFHRDGQGATHCDPGGKRWLASRDWWSWVAGLKLLIFGAQYGRGIPKNHMHSMVFPCGSTASWNDNGSAVTEKHNSKRQDGYLWPWRWDSFRAAWWNNGHPLTSAESSHRTTMNPAIEAAGKGLELHVFHEKDWDLSWSMLKPPIELKWGCAETVCPRNPSKWIDMVLWCCLWVL